jgi:hypothetical protein
MVQTSGNWASDADKDAFTKYVTPLAKIKAGTLDPWEASQLRTFRRLLITHMGLDVLRLKIMMSGVVWSAHFSSFFSSAFETDNGLLKISYRLQSWRNAFSTPVINAVKARIDEDAQLTPNDIAAAMDVYLNPSWHSSYLSIFLA